MRRFSFVRAFVVSLVLLGIWGGAAESQARVDDRNDVLVSSSRDVESYLLGQFSGAHAAYSLRQLRADYAGPALRIRRASDGATQDIGFTSAGWIDTAAIEAFVGTGDATVVRWYAQVEGAPDLVQSSTDAQPWIAENGAVTTDERMKPAVHFEADDYMESGAFSNPLPRTDYTMLGVLHAPENGANETEAFGLGTLDDKYWETAAYRFTQSYINGSSVRFGGPPIDYNGRNLIIMKNDGSTASLWAGNEKVDEVTSSENGAISDPNTNSKVSVGAGFTGTVGELAFFPARTSGTILDLYRNVTADWEVGPAEWNQDALLPQQFEYQTVLYDWLETLQEDDVTLPQGTIRWDGTYANADSLADLWLQVRGLSASSVTRSEPGWYVLDNGNGKGIEATGSVKNNDEPRGNKDYGGNPPRSWANEPALLYKLDIPLSDGGQGNPWHRNPALGRRAMVVAMVDLMMHHQSWLENDPTGWYDMVGKAFLGWAEAYRWTGEELPPDVQAAFETGMGHVLDHLIDTDPRAVNTNMGMFAIQGMADFYMATDDPTLKTKAVQAAKDALFGYVDGELETKHKMWATGDWDGGVFSPSGPIMEGDQPEVFYQGESIYQLMGALQAVTNRETGSTQQDWVWLEEVMHRAQRWRTYQMFYDPYVNGSDVGGLSEHTLITAGAGFSGRTSYGVPHGQAGDIWKSIGIADRFENNAFKANGLPNLGEMENEIAGTLSYIDGEMASTYTGTPDDWEGWSPWVKATPYLPPKGWYSDLKRMEQAGDPQIEGPPAARVGTTWNKTFGGPPTGKEFWSYKQEDASGNAFGFFVEAMPKQGLYGGWYGGKIETFWTERTGVILVNRHGKAGCDRSGPGDYNNFEDSTCWFNLDSKAGHHVWGRDETGNGFTTLLLRGRELSRTSNFDTGGGAPTVSVNNVFNDPSHSTGTAGKSGEETGAEIEGSFEVKNTFEAQQDGVEVTHTLTSDETDVVTELWASLPIYLRHANPYRAGNDYQGNMEDTSIEYWTGSEWNAMPEDADGDGVPEMIQTEALRIGRDYGDGSGPRFAYVSFAGSQNLRLALRKYYDPYQSKTGVRTVHIDLHGNPGSEKTLPGVKSVRYTLQTTDPTGDGSTLTGQDIELRKGGNLVSSSVAPVEPDMDAVFADVRSMVRVVENEAGEQYRPADDVNEIGQWRANEVYRVYMDAEATLTIEGEPQSASSITLSEGWNWIPYPLWAILSVDDALGSIADQLVLLKDETGRVYAPDKGIDVLTQMAPGEGYKVYVRQSTILDYPEVSN